MNNDFSKITPVFSGHETFTLRGSWLKKAHDLLKKPDYRLSQDNAFALLGVGKNMANSVRYWGRMCGMFDRVDNQGTYVLTPLGENLLADTTGWDPFLKQPASWWLLHWNIATRPTAFTWYYTFNLLRGGEFTIEKLSTQIISFAEKQEKWKAPSATTIKRDIECMLHTYGATMRQQTTNVAEDMLMCPLSKLQLIRPIPSVQSYRLQSGPRPNLPDELIVYAIHKMVMESKKRTLLFNELA